MACFLSFVIVFLILTECLHGETSLKEEQQSSFVLKQGIIKSGLGRVKRQADNSDLVVDVKFPMKKNKKITGFTEEEKRNMVHIHNAYRSLVRPLAADMIEVTWDDDIAAFAQEWADQCTATHRPSRDLDPWVNMGENIYWWFSGKYNEAMSVKWWWDEVQHYTIQNKSCNAPKGEVCGHYVTMTWAKTEKIGCGVNRCQRLDDLPDYGRACYYFVCSYSGRFVSKTKPYIATDIPCSSCHHTDYPKCRYNLCVTQEMIDNDIGYNGSTAITGLTRSETYSSGKTPTDTTHEPTTTTTTEPTTTTKETTATTEPTTTTERITTTTKPTTTTTKPTTTTTKPTTTTTKPTTTTTKPTTTTTTTTTKPTTTTTTTTTTPTTTTTKPTTTSTKPTTTTTKPTTTSTKPTTTTTKPTTTSTKPTTTTTKPTTTSTNPTTTTTKPTTTSTKPTTTTTKPTTTSTKPTTTTTKPTTTTTKPTTTSTKPTTTTTKPTTTTTQPTTTTTKSTTTTIESTPDVISIETTTELTNIISELTIIISEPTTVSSELTTITSEPTTPDTETTTAHPITTPTTATQSSKRAPLPPPLNTETIATTSPPAKKTPKLTTTTAQPTRSTTKPTTTKAQPLTTRTTTTESLFYHRNNWLMGLSGASSISMSIPLLMVSLHVTFYRSISS